MSIKPVTYHRVECNAPDCKITTSDLGDYSAWADAGDAHDQWTDCDGVVLDDGRTFCEEHALPYRCVECTETFQQPLELKDGEYRCVDCLAEQAGSPAAGER